MLFLVKEEIWTTELIMLCINVVKMRRKPNYMCTEEKYQMSIDMGKVILLGID